MHDPFGSFVRHSRLLSQRVRCNTREMLLSASIHRLIVTVFVVDAAKATRPSNLIICLGTSETIFDCSAFLAILKMLTATKSFTPLLIITVSVSASDRLRSFGSSVHIYDVTNTCNTPKHGLSNFFH